MDTTLEHNIPSNKVRCDLYFIYNYMPDFSAPVISYSYNYTCYLNIKLELPPLDHKDGKIPLHLLKKKYCMY